MADRLLPLVLGCAAAIASALGVVLARRPVHGALFLLVHSLSIASLYLCLDAQFAAVAQVTVYSGAIVVLFLFVVLLLPDGGREPDAGWSRRGIALFAGAVVAIALFDAMTEAWRAKAAPIAASTELTVRGLARNLFGAQIVPLELTAALLLVAIVGGVSLWHRQGAERKR